MNPKEKLERFCAYQERCEADVQKKLNDLNVDISLQKKLIAHLKEAGFLNEERFLESYVNGKLRQNKWGKKKIKFSLLQKHINPKNIEIALDQIDMEEYNRIIRTLYEKKFNSLKSEKNDYLRKQKTLQYLSSKGFQPNEVMDLFGA